MICSHSWWANGICPGQNIFDHDVLSCLSFVWLRVACCCHPMVIQGISLFASALWQIHNRLRGSGVQESIGLMQFTPGCRNLCWWVPWVVVSLFPLPPRRLLVSSSTDGFLFVWRDSSLSKDSFGVGLTTCCRALKLKCVCIHQREEIQRSLCGRRFPSMFFWANLVQRYLKESSPIFGFRARHKPKFGPCCCTMLHVGTQLPEKNPGARFFAEAGWKSTWCRWISPSKHLY